jgi:hypothetical protein
VTEKVDTNSKEQIPVFHGQRLVQVQQAAAAAAAVVCKSTVKHGSKPPSDLCENPDD